MAKQKDTKQPEIQAQDLKLLKHRKPIWVAFQDIGGSQGVRFAVREYLLSHTDKLGAVAVHRAVSWYGVDTSSYAVTHVRTGFAMAAGPYPLSAFEALAIAQARADRITPAKLREAERLPDVTTYPIRKDLSRRSK